MIRQIFTYVCVSACKWCTPTCSTKCLTTSKFPLCAASCRGVEPISSWARIAAGPPTWERLLTACKYPWISTMILVLEASGVKIMTWRRRLKKRTALCMHWLMYMCMSLCLCVCAWIPCERLRGGQFDPSVQSETHTKAQNMQRFHTRIVSMHKTPKQATRQRNLHQTMLEFLTYIYRFTTNKPPYARKPPRTMYKPLYAYDVQVPICTQQDNGTCIKQSWRSSICRSRSLSASYKRTNT